MDHMSRIIPNMTSQSSGNRISKLLTPYDIEKGICEQCNKEVDVYYKMDVPTGKTIEYKSKICFECNRENENKRLAREAWAEREAAKRSKLMSFFNENSLINKKLLDATFDNYTPTSPELEKAKLICKRYADNFKKDNPVSLLLFGTYGVGKSHLSVSIIKSLMDKEFTSLFISTPKLLSKLRSTYNKDSGMSEGELIEHLNNVDCLVIDDLGAEKNSDWAMEKIFEIIDGRSGKHTIYTTNFKPAELKANIGDRNFSRVMEDTHLIEMNGKDYRLKNF